MKNEILKTEQKYQDNNIKMDFEKINNMCNDFKPIVLPTRESNQKVGNDFQTLFATLYQGHASPIMTKKNTINLGPKATVNREVPIFAEVFAKRVKLMKKNKGNGLDDTSYESIQLSTVLQNKIYQQIPRY